MLKQRILMPMLITFAAISMQGCASLMQYRVDEQMLETYLNREVARLDKQQLEQGGPVSFRLSKADITLGANGQEGVILDAEGSVALNALLVNLPVNVALKVEGTPVYVAAENAIYIRRLKLLTGELQSPFFKGDLAPVTEAAVRSLAMLLEQTPVYRLDPEAFPHRLLSFSKLQMRVEAGALVFEPANDKTADQAR